MLLIFNVRGARRGRLQTSFRENTIDYGRRAAGDGQDKLPWIRWVEYVWIDWEHCNEVDNLSETIQFRDFLRAWERGSVERGAWEREERGSVKSVKRKRSHVLTLLNAAAENPKVEESEGRNPKNPSVLRSCSDFGF